MWFLRSKPGPVEAEPLYGVNLGGWLVLEKWLTPSLFKDTPALDEHSLYHLEDPAAQAAIQKHHAKFITKADFVWLKERGIDAVRLPVGYGVFGDFPPYPSTAAYVDKAFDWARQTGIKVLLDLHTAPGSQNGKQESGRIGPVQWHKNEQNIIATLRVIKKLAKRYGGREELLGIELLNEPHSKIPRRKLNRYYEAAYKIIREHSGPEAWVVFSDGFKPRRWKRKLRAPRFESTFIDTHQYQAFSRRDQRLNTLGHLKKTLKKVPRHLSRMQKYHPVIVGEWSMALNPKSLKGLDEAQMRAARSAYGNAQMIAYAGTGAWFYWTYRTEDKGPWSYRDSVEKGWILPPR